MTPTLRDVGERTEAVLVHVHPSAVRDLRDGSVVVVESPFGSTTGVLRIDPTLAPRAVSIPHGWDTTNVCALTDTDADVDPYSGMVWQSGIPVTVRPA